MAIVEYTADELANETWNPIPDFECLYEVSNLGRVRNIRTARIRRPGVDKDGYLRLGFSKDKRPKTYGVHRLVMAAFIGKCPDGYEVHHLDNNPSNPRLENLEYVTPCQNQGYRYSTDGKTYIPKNPVASRVHLGGTCPRKLNPEAVRDIRNLLASNQATVQEIAIRYNIHIKYVADVYRGRYWPHVK
jgi:hypothetical protein